MAPTPASLMATLMDCSITGTLTCTGNVHAAVKELFVVYQMDGTPVVDWAIQAAMACPLGETARSMAVVRTPGTVSLKSEVSVPVLVVLRALEGLAVAGEEVTINLIMLQVRAVSVVVAVEVLTQKQPSTHLVGRVVLAEAAVMVQAIRVVVQEVLVGEEEAITLS